MPPQPSGSPNFYKITAAAFFIISGVLFWFAATRHLWFYWFMAAITLMNGIMTTLKFFVVREQRNNG
ncbi:MAG TPA: hypothetical protein VN176_19185 [Verrucomicrobiae bacterium]|jgi:hypothetical protein|nr:hypothetical protein [Verrucomicrobiae bacterium]